MQRAPFFLGIILGILTPLRAAELAGAPGPVGTKAGAKLVHRLEITKPGVYENFRVDAQGQGGNIVKITADDVTLRNCEIFNGTGNGVGVFGTRVVIENCRIHHLLNGTFEEQNDAHGITGRWGDVTIRNCDISHISGDCIQFDPDRKLRGSLTIEQCHLWAGPLAKDAPGFKAGQSPGENAFDSKTPPDGERCKLTIRQCYMHGWNQPSQISTRAALNLKEHIDAVISHCVFDNNEVAIRVRGPGGRGDARVKVEDCAIYHTQVGVREEDKIEGLKILRMAYGPDVKSREERHRGKVLPGYENTGEHDAPPIDSLIVKPQS
ncbi:MAG: right-handed parallel beta-helix repeat-containing protein [Prosthecobacter sp.]|uniref:right-handed parallel beta-helix repeat-containing protein n=1 Tax=Prosthecobacter sp. TaxID=1965333 RepID=UPI0025DD3F27|nr:right-handed parallel beta-helix repeat-containing protein [Prosthecobacter sp.]MCF7787615.1 right-handed parallel beta-helix repeat-containing protein [Prosthecobacter sp.]